MLNNCRGFWGVALLVGLAILLGGNLSDSAWAQTRPALTRDVDNGDRQTLKADGFQIEILGGSMGGNYCDDATVPVGKRWIIEHISARVELPAETQVPRLTVDIHLLPLTYVGQIAATVYQWVGSQPMKVRLTEGESLCAELVRGAGTVGRAYFFIKYSGYQIDAP